MFLLGALIVSGVLWWASQQIVSELRAARADASRARAAAVLELFAPALTATQHDPRAFLIWQPLARAARQLFPEEFATLDRAWGGTFPFTAERLEAAHAQWTADWLAWEHAHDAEYKMKAAVAEHELNAQGGAPQARAKLETVEREKIELYQRRYAEYVRIAKALQALGGA
jgi:hypothetical protein